MRDISKYCGVIPAFYACYNEQGEVDSERVKALTQYFIDAGVKGVYVGGSSGECIYQTVPERKKTLEAVMEVGRGKLTVIAHVACNSTFESLELAAHADSLGVDAIAAIPPIYFKLPQHAIANYWNEISQAAPNTDFIIYNIPQLAGVALTQGLLLEMMKNPRVIGVKNSSPATQDIELWKATGGKDFAVFNGPDEQFISGLAIGADGGIGGTYAVMPELFLKAWDALYAGDLQKAAAIQGDINLVIYRMCAGRSNMYAVAKEVLRRRVNVDIGSVRGPLYPLQAEDVHLADECVAMINDAIAKY